MSSEYGSGGKRDLLATQAVDDNIKEAQLFCNENTQSGVFSGRSQFSVMPFCVRGFRHAHKFDYKTVVKLEAFQAESKKLPRHFSNTTHKSSSPPPIPQTMFNRVTLHRWQLCCYLVYKLWISPAL